MRRREHVPLHRKADELLDAWHTNDRLKLMAELRLRLKLTGERPDLHDLIKMTMNKYSYATEQKIRDILIELVWSGQRERMNTNFKPFRYSPSHFRKRKSGNCAVDKIGESK